MAKRPLNLLVTTLQLVYEFDGLLEEIEPHQRWLAALPGYSHLRCPMTFQFQNTLRPFENGLPGYNISFDKKKHYLQSRLQIAPVGLIKTWNEVAHLPGK